MFDHPVCFHSGKLDSGEAVNATSSPQVDKQTSMESGSNNACENLDSIPFISKLRTRKTCLRTRKHASSFLDTYINGYYFQTLADTGNLSRIDLLDYSVLKKAFKGKELPKFTPTKHPIRTAGYHKLKGMGTCKVEMKFGEYSQVWTTNAYVVKNLGVPAILSADSMARMPLIIDLSKSKALIGPTRADIPLRPLRIGRKSEPSLNGIKLTAPVGYFKGDDLKQTEYSRLKTDLMIRPQSIAYACISLPDDTKARQTFYFEQGSDALKRRRLNASDCVAYSQRRLLVKSRDGKYKHMPAGLYVPIVNFTDEVRHLRAGEVIGKHSLIQRVSKTTGKATGRLRGADLHAISEPIKLLPIPDIKNLKGKSLKAIKAALDKYAGPCTITDPKKLQKMKEELNELNGGQIENGPLTKESKELLYHVLIRFYDYFSKHKYDVGKTDLIEFEVETGDASPYKARTRPMNPKVLKIFQAHLKAMLDAGIWAPGFGAWASALHQVVKVESGDLRFVVDLREVNKVTKTDSYPIAHQQMAIASEEFRKAESFINLDLTGAYLAVPVEKESQDKLAVTTCEGLFKCLRMPFGAKNACGCYARLMRLVFNDMMLRKESLSFFDDHLIPCPDFLTGIFRLAKFMFAISKANLRVSLKKSHFFVKKVKWLGFEATAGELLPSDRHIAKVRDWPTPKNSAEIQSFYGLASYHRKFIKDFARIARPIKQVEAEEKKTGKFNWTKEAQNAFQYLKDKLVTKPVLAHPDFSKPFILNTDASLYAMGAELSQVQDGKERVIEYASRLFNKSEANYSVTRKELLAIVTFVEEFSYYLDKNPFIIRTDHSALTWFRDSKNLTGQLWRWWEILHPFQYTIEHRAGLKHGNADALSRYPYPQKEIDKLLPKFTQKDKIMYEKLGLKPPTRGSLGRKLNESFHRANYYKNSSINNKKAHKDSVNQERKNTIIGVNNSKLSSLPTVHNYLGPHNKPQTGITCTNNPNNQARSCRAGNCVPGVYITTRSQAFPSEEDESDEQPPEFEYNDAWRGDETIQVDGQDISVLEAEEQTISTNENPEDCQCLETTIENSEGLPPQDKLRPQANIITNKPFESFDMAQEQIRDPVITQVKRWVADGKRPNWDDCESQPLKEYYKKFRQLKEMDSQLYLVEGAYKRLCIPEHLIVKIIDLLHQHPLAGHIGQFRTYMQARKLFYWPSMTEHIEQAIGSCDICIRAKKRKPDKRVPLGQTSTAVNRRFSVFYADLVGPWIKKPIPGKYQYLLTLMDGFTKYPEAIPIPRADTQTVLRALTTHIIPRYGVGFKLVTDRGSQFTSAIFKEACAKLGLLTATTQAYEPHSNPVERMHRTLESAIRCLMLQNGSAKPSTWSDYVPAALASIRQSPLSNLSYSPHLLTYGEEPIVPAQMSTGHTNGQLRERDPLDGIELLGKAMKDIRAKQLHNHEKNKKYYDKKVKEQPLKVGDKVYLWSNLDDSPLGNLRKTSTYYKGPYEVLEVRNERQVRIQKGGTDVVVSRDRLSLLPNPEFSSALKLSREGHIPGFPSDNASLRERPSTKTVQRVAQNESGVGSNSDSLGNSRVIPQTSSTQRRPLQGVRGGVPDQADQGSSFSAQATSSPSSSSSRPMGSSVSAPRVRFADRCLLEVSTRSADLGRSDGSQSQRATAVPDPGIVEGPSSPGLDFEPRTSNPGLQARTSRSADFYESPTTNSRPAIVSGSRGQGRCRTRRVTRSLSSTGNTVSLPSSPSTSKSTSSEPTGESSGSAVCISESITSSGRSGSTSSEPIDPGLQGAVTGEKPTQLFVAVLNDAKHYLLNHIGFISALTEKVSRKFPHLSTQVNLLQQLVAKFSSKKEFWPFCFLIPGRPLLDIITALADRFQLPYVFHPFKSPWTKLSLSVLKDLSETNLKKGRQTGPGRPKKQVLPKSILYELIEVVKKGLQVVVLPDELEARQRKQYFQKSTVNYNMYSFFADSVVDTVPVCP